MVSGSEKVTKKSTSGASSKTKAKAPSKIKAVTAKTASAKARPARRAKPAARVEAKAQEPAAVVAAEVTIQADDPAPQATTPAMLEGLPPVADAAPATPRVVQSALPVVQGPEMKKRELVDKVVKRAGVKKKDARQVVDAMLAVLGEALAESRELNLKPLGRLKVTKVRQINGGRMMICKLRQGGAGENEGKEALAEDED